LRSSTAVDELTNWSKGADKMATTLQADIQDIKSRIVALEKLSATPKVPPREEEGRANGHSKNNVIQGDGGLGLPPLTMGKGEY
jgi:hypothetical protein